MPLSSNPKARAKFWLAVDEEIPLPQRPVFLVRFMTVAEHEQHQHLMTEAAAEKDDDKSYALWKQALQIGVVGWNNLTFADGSPVPFDFNALLTPGLLTHHEAWELGWWYPSAVRLVRADLGNSDSPAPSTAGAQAAEVAQPAAA